jgi:hypothetical protein
MEARHHGDFDDSRPGIFGICRTVRQTLGRRWRETVTLLGDQFDEAMPWAAKVPEWADDRSRMLFLGKVPGTLAGVPSWLLPEQSFDLETDENTKLPVIEVES